MSRISRLIKFETDKTFPFHLYNFVVPCIDSYLTSWELFYFYQCSKDLKLQISVLWKRRAVKLKLLSKESTVYGLKECLAFVDFQLEGKSYKTYIQKRFLLTLDDIQHVLEPTLHRVHGSCHIVSKSEAFRICSMKYDGINNFLKIKKQKDEEEKQRLAKFETDRTVRLARLNEFAKRLSKLENTELYFRMSSLRGSLGNAKSMTNLLEFDKLFEKLEESLLCIRNNLNVFENVFTCDLYSACEEYLDEISEEKLQERFVRETSRINMIASVLSRKNLKKLSPSALFQCRKFVREFEGKDDEKEAREIDQKWKELTHLLEEEKWLIENTRFAEIKQGELEKDSEYLEEMTGYASGGWESEDDEKNEAMIDGDIYKFKRKLALSEYLMQNESPDLTLIPQSLHTEIFNMKQAVQAKQKLQSKYKHVPIGIPRATIRSFDEYIENAINNRSFTTPPIRQAWLRKILHQMAQERKLYTKTTKDRVLISRFRIIIFDDS